MDRAIAKERPAGRRRLNSFVLTWLTPKNKGDPLTKKFKE